MRKISAEHKTTVGASLLAKAPGQATAMLNVAPTSRAGSLPQGVWIRSESWIRRCRSGMQRICGGQEINSSPSVNYFVSACI
ncbi:hypothetical protein PspCFBP13508_03350 [Pseudomonas sp. CFBP13508]|nr:hypothetical protein PspCFBP13508_03350 [Pseudomonas sp. CFBP13508]